MNPDLKHTLDLALQHLQAGHLDAAQDCCLKVHRKNAHLPEALHLLGIIALQKGHAEEAIRWIRRSLAKNPTLPEAHNNLGNALKAFGQLDEAVVSYHQALTLRPDYANAHNNLAATLLEQGAYQKAVDHFTKALALIGPHPQIINNLGNAFQKLEQWDTAITHYQQALHLVPAFPEALNNLGQALVNQGRIDEGLEKLAQAVQIKPDYVDALINLGAALKENGQKDEAIRILRRALDVQPDHIHVCYNLGTILLELGRMDEATDCYNQVLERDPNHLLAWNNLGVTHQKQNRLDAAINAFNQVLSLQPDFYQAINNLGVTDFKKGQFREAIEKFLRVETMAPDYPDAYYNEGMVRLALGEFQRGWMCCEWRLKMDSFRIRSDVKLLTDPNAAQGHHVLIHCEQGIGDSIQFVRYAAMVKQLGATVVVFCPEPLETVFKTITGIDHLSSHPDDLPACTHVIPTLSLPWLFKTDANTIPAPIPYLFADPARIAKMRSQLPDITGFKVGLVWRGNPKHTNDNNRSIKAAVISRLLDGINCHFINLQLELNAQEQTLFAGKANWWNVSDAISDFADTAALVEQLDLVITVDTAVAHLAGAMGRETWVLLPAVADWRWLQHRSDSPWYPSMRLFRQPASGDWPSVVATVKAALTVRCQPE
ncbi:MAG: tetratricopeptide repeat protein [Magnetococcus sp. THC-1_WYH]